MVFFKKIRKFFDFFTKSLLHTLCFFSKFSKKIRFFLSKYLYPSYIVFFSNFSRKKFDFFQSHYILPTLCFFSKISKKNSIFSKSLYLFTLRFFSNFSRKKFDFFPKSLYYHTLCFIQNFRKKIRFFSKSLYLILCFYSKLLLHFDTVRKNNHNSALMKKMERETTVYKKLGEKKF